jgi:tRNA(Ile)-lysidine synthetase-like protein
MRLPLKAAGEIRRRRLLAPGAVVLTALSGGPDSVALLLCLLELSAKRDLRFRLVAAHLNHRLRGSDADADLKFCRALCRRKNIPLLAASCEVGTLSRNLQRSLEETGRWARQCFFQQAAAACGASAISLGHHADDRVETVLFRLCRGTGFAGLRGIAWKNAPPRLEIAGLADQIFWDSDNRLPPDLKPTAAKSYRVPLVRPLLSCTRSEIVAYLRQKRQRARHDATNADTNIPRNALRHEVLPLLEKKVHPGVRAALWRLTEEADGCSKKKIKSHKPIADKPRSR